MSAAEKKYTERDVVLRERKAFERGAAWFFCTPAVRPEAWDKAGGDEGARVAASEVFPLPKVERPRVVRDPHAANVEWSTKRRDGISHPVITHRVYGVDRWDDYPYQPRPVQYFPTPERVALWADLLANPTELVEDGDEQVVRTGAIESPSRTVTP